MLDGGEAHILKDKCEPLQEDNKQNKFQFTETLVSHKTPVLFSTNRGLHIRRTKNWQIPNHDSQKYDIQFCDLERWSTNRANTVSLSEENPQNYSNNSNRVRSVRFVMERSHNNKIRDGKKS